MVAQPYTDEWEKERLGKLTASRFFDAIDQLKNGGWKKARWDYMLELVAERLTGMRKEKYLNGPMLWGVETEPQALAVYAKKRGEINPGHFVNHPTLAMSGATPDGFVGDDGLVEVKCPNSDTHVATLLQKIVPDEYLTQALWQLACTGRQWCDYLSYDPRMPPALRAAVIRIERDRKQITRLEALAVDFLTEVESLTDALRDGKPHVPEWIRLKGAPL